MPVPPNYRVGESTSRSCDFCANFRIYETRVICLKHLTYVLLTRTCDDWKLGEGPRAEFGLQRKELNETEMEIVHSAQLLDPHPITVKPVFSFEDIES